VLLGVGVTKPEDPMPQMICLNVSEKLIAIGNRSAFRK